MKKSPFILFLNDVSKSDFLKVGGKGSNLGEMIKNSLPVPEGFVVSCDAYESFIIENCIQRKILNYISEVNLENTQELELISQKIKNLILNSPISNLILDEIKLAYNSIGNPTVAVRSSATAEDLPGMSFAGQYDSYLNVQGEESLFQHIKKCWASLWNDRAIAYRLKQNIDNNNLAHAVVVQKLIDAEKSGILFTANPLNGRRDHILLNSSWGLGEAIVGGKVNPDQWIVDKNNSIIIEEKIAKKEIMSIRKKNGIEFADVSNEKKNLVSLNKNEVLILLDLAIKVENYFGSPQDIEWAYKDGKFYLVQSRPITSLYPMPEIRNNKTDIRLFININNYSQAMKEPFTPMGESVVKSMVSDVVYRLCKRNNSANQLWWYQVIGGRIFLDLTEFLRKEKFWNKFKNDDPNDKDPITTKALLQFLEKNRNDILDDAKGIKLLNLLNIRLIKFGLSSVIKFCYGIFNPVIARKKALKLSKESILEMTDKMSKCNSLNDKIGFIEKYAGKLILDGFGIVFYVAVSSTYIEKVKSLLNECSLDISDLNLVEKSVPYSATTEMGMELLKIAKHYAEAGKKPTVEDKKIQEFLHKYGHRSSIELDVGIPCWKEEPKYVLDLIDTYIKNEHYKEGLNKFYQGQKEAVKAIYKIQYKLAEQGYKSKAKKVRKMLLDFRNMFGIREQSKFYITKALSIFRNVLIDIGEDLASKEIISDKLDIFFLTLEDLKDIVQYLKTESSIDSSENFKSIVKTRKENYKLQLNMNAPRLLSSTGESIYSAKEEGSENSLIGIPVSPGIYEGKVKVLANPEQGYLLEQGDILVTTGTNPAWTPLFLKIGALIMETGGAISHGSVVAREYGVPAVAGVVNATTVLKDGEKVKVNGESGIVEIL